MHPLCRPPVPDGAQSIVKGRITLFILVFAQLYHGFTLGH